MKTRMIIVSLLSIAIVAASWIMNFGFIRLFFSVIYIPVVHAVAVLSIGIVAAHYASQRKIRMYNIMVCATYVLSNILFPDTDEVCSKMFFGLIKVSDVVFWEALSALFLLSHLIFIVLQFVEISRTNKELEQIE